MMRFKRKETAETAILYSLSPPSKWQERRFEAFLKKQYGHDITLVWKQSTAYAAGFRLEVGSEIYDWTAEGKLQQLKEKLQNIPTKTDNIISLIRETVDNWQPQVMPQEMGKVLTVGDGIATISGLEHATYGEILIFATGTRGMVQELRKDEIGCILFEEDDAISEGTEVRRTGKTAGVPVGDAFLGRVVNPLGMPIDGRGEIKEDGD
ncbi:MAG: F0F1 ATP synthase subunit delta [Eubacterium sp.]|nr:F0F1 ATP synthase subunit delta [Eubacterium sp.]